MKTFCAFDASSAVTQKTGMVQRRAAHVEWTAFSGVGRACQGQAINAANELMPKVLRRRAVSSTGAVPVKAKKKISGNSPRSGYTHATRSKIQTRGGYAKQAAIVDVSAACASIMVNACEPKRPVVPDRPVAAEQ